MTYSRLLISAQFLLLAWSQAAFAQPDPTNASSSVTGGHAALVALQNSVLLHAKAAMQGGKPTVELQTGIFTKVKGYREKQETIWAASLETYDGETAISFPMLAYSRQTLLYGQVGIASSGTIFVTDKMIVYRTERGKVTFSCSKPTCMLKQEGGREQDTFSLYDGEHGNRFRFGPPRFDSPFMIFLRAAVTDFQRTYSQAEHFAASVPSEYPSQNIQLVQQELVPHRAEQADQQQAPRLGVDQQTIQQRAETEEAARKQQIEQRRSDIQIQQQNAANWEKSIQDMSESNNSNCTMSGLLGALCHGVGTAGIAKAKKEAAKARNQIARDQEELERLQGLEVQDRPRQDESFGGNFQQAATQTGVNNPTMNASAATAGLPQASDPQAESEKATYQAGRHYQGTDSGWVSFLLEKNGNWECPTSSSQSNSAQGFTNRQNNVCMRDSYVWAAVLEAWGAECESRLSRDEAAAQNATAMHENLVYAAKLCSNAPVFGAGPECGTAKIVDCGQLAPLKNQK